MQRITQVGVLSLGKVMGLFMTVFGAFIVLLYGVVFLAVFSTGAVVGSGPKMPGPTELGMVVFFVMIGAVVLPLVYGLLGFIMGVIYAWVFNLVASFTGGLEVKIQVD